MIREMNISDIEEVSTLIKDVFREFIGPGYSTEGNNTFYEYITPSKMKERQSENYITLINVEKEEINGIIELRGNNHISLFFVKSNKHNKGIGRKLLKEILNRVENTADYLEVNASPYSVVIYERLGFKQQIEMQEKNGIKYVPMLMRIDKNKKL